MSAAVPCRICGCIDGEPGLCHAVTPAGLACYRPAKYPDWCSACACWDKQLRQQWPLVPLEAHAANYRATQAEAAAAKRGQSVPGAFALRVHAARMRRKAVEFARAAGALPTPEPGPIKERDLPLSPQ